MLGLFIIPLRVKADAKNMHTPFFLVKNEFLITLLTYISSLFSTVDEMFMLPELTPVLYSVGIITIYVLTLKIHNTELGSRLIM